MGANIDWKSAFLKGMGQFRPNFHVEWDLPTNLFLRMDRAMNALQLFYLTFSKVFKNIIVSFYSF